MKKLLQIPRAVMDIISVGAKDITVAEKSSLTYALLVLKLKKWLCKKGEIITFPLFGLKIHCCIGQSIQHLLKEIFLDQVYDLSHFFKPEQPLHFIDAGANIGLCTLFFKRNFINADIISYEPAQASFQLLKENVGRKKLSGVTVEQIAVSNKDGILYADKGFGPCSENQTFAEEGEETDAIRCIRFADVLKRKNWDCVKLDIEGAEIEVLIDVINQGALKQSLTWLIEFHKEDDKKEWILKEFEKEGFVCTRKKEVYCFVQDQKSFRAN